MKCGNFVSIAKQVLKSAHTTTLMIVPLLVVLGNVAHAGAILPTEIATCGVAGDGASGDCAAVVQQLPTADNGIQGVKLYLQDPVSYLGAAPILVSFLGLAVNGYLTGGGITAGTLIPLSYHFDLEVSSGSIIDWTLDYSFTEGLGSEIQSNSVGGAINDGSSFAFASFTGSEGGAINGVGNFTVPSDMFEGTEVLIRMDLIVRWSANDGELIINIPSNSLDVNAVNNGVPEPGSIALFSSGVALLGWQLFRARKRLK